MNKIVFSLAFFLTTFYISLNTFIPFLDTPTLSTSIIKLPVVEKNLLLLQNKISLDIKVKSNKLIKLTKEISSASLDMEGKIIGHKDLWLIPNQHVLLLTSQNQGLRKSTLFGLMKFIKL